MKCRFEWEGKTYETEGAGSYVRLPDGTTLRVTSRKSDGTADVTKTSKTNSLADAATEIQVSTTEEVADKVTDEPAKRPHQDLKQSALFALWKDHNDANVAAQEAAKQAAAALAPVEEEIATRLLAAGKNAIVELPGGVKVKAAKTDAGPRLRRVTEARMVNLDGAP